MRYVKLSLYYLLMLVVIGFGVTEVLSTVVDVVKLFEIKGGPPR